MDKRQMFIQVIPMLPVKDHNFANSLLFSWKKYGSLKPNQEKWVDILIDRATAPPKALEQVDVGDFAGVIAMFLEAKKHLKYPKIKLMVNGGPIQLSLAGNQSKYPGSVNVTDGGPYGSNKWYGRVSPDGKFAKGGAANDDVVAFLAEFSKDPEKIAAAYGKMTGNCCFCMKSLTDPQSVAAGFGPVCAKNYGLMAKYKGAH